MPKIVFSKTLDQVKWNSRLVRGNIADEVNKLKEQPGKAMSVGGAEIASTFMQLGLIDEYRLFMNPVVLGGGTPFFPSLHNPINLRLVEARTFSSGVVLLRYCVQTMGKSDSTTTGIATNNRRHQHDKEHYQ